MRYDWAAAEESQLLVDTRMLVAAAAAVVVVMGFAGREGFHSEPYLGRSSAALNYNGFEPGAERVDVEGSPKLAAAGVAAVANGFAALVAVCAAAVAGCAAADAGFAAADAGFAAAAVEVDGVFVLTVYSHSGDGCCRIPLLAAAVRPAPVVLPHLEVEVRAAAASCHQSGIAPPLNCHCCLSSPVQDSLCVPRGMVELLDGGEIY